MRREIGLELVSRLLGGLGVAYLGGVLSGPEQALGFALNRGINDLPP